MTCDCIEIVDAKLAERNTRIVRPLMIYDPGAVTVMIETEQVQTGRGKPKAVGMFATYCPWCGVAYKPEQK